MGNDLRNGQRVLLIGLFPKELAQAKQLQFLGWLFGLGDGVQLLRPQWAVEELRRQLSAVAELYPEG